MRNFFYAPFLALMLLLGSCTDSSEVDDGTGTTDTGIDAAFVVQPSDVEFDTNFKRWDETTISFSVDPGSYRVHSGSFVLETNDYYTTSIKAADEDYTDEEGNTYDTYDIRFLASSDGEALVDGDTLTMSLTMIFNGFTSVLSDPFTVILPPDKYSPYYTSQPSDAAFKAGFEAGDYCETTFSVNPMDANIDASSFSVGSNANFTAEFFATDEENTYTARFYATQIAVEYASAVLSGYYGGEAPEYVENIRWGDSTAILMTTVGVPVDDPEVYSSNIHIKTLLANEAPEFSVEPNNIEFPVNFETDDVQIVEFTVDPGTKDISVSSFAISSNDFYDVYSITETVENTFQVRLLPTDAAVSDIIDAEEIVAAQVIMSYDEYGDTLAVNTSFDVTFPKPEYRAPEFESVPQYVTFASGAVAGTTEVTSTFVLDPGTLTVGASNISLVSAEYAAVTFEETSNKNEWKATFTLTDAAINQALGSDSFTFALQLVVNADGPNGAVEIKSDEFDVTLMGRLVFDHYIQDITYSSAVCNVAAFSSLIANADIIEKGVVYTTGDATTDKSTWTPVTVDGKTGNGSRYAYKCVIPDLTASTTYYAAPYVKQDGLVSYGETTTFTTLASRTSSPAQGNVSVTYNSTPTDETESAAFTAAITEALWYINTYANTSAVSFAISYNPTGTSTTITTSAITLHPGVLTTANVLYCLTRAYGIGLHSTWANMISGTNYRLTKANALFNEFSNQDGAYIQVSSSSMEDYGLTDASSSTTQTELIIHSMLFAKMASEGLRTTNNDGTSFTPIEGVNVALRKTASADSYYSTAYLPANAVDGNRVDEASRWITSNTAPNWIEVDLGDTYDVTGFNVYFGKTYTTTGYTTTSVYMSSWSFGYYGTVNGVSSLITAYSSTDKTSTACVGFDSPISCSKVRFTVSSRASGVNCFIYEFQVMTDYAR